MKPTWTDLYLAVQGAEVLDAQKSARIAALESAAKKLLDELHWYTPHSTAQRDAESELRALLKS